MQKNCYGVAVVLSLIALRVGIGVHFSREGASKFRDPQPFSAGFFGSAKGPFASVYQGFVWDRDGLARLDREKTLSAWGQLRARAEQSFGYTEDQKKLAGKIQKRTEDQFKEHLDVHSSEIAEYYQNLARRDRYRADRQRMETVSLRDQVTKIENELRTTRNKLVGPIDLMWQNYVRDLNGIATADQRRGGLISLNKPGRRFLDSESIDKFIPWFDMTLGALLIVGLFTRVAAFAAAAFLLSVIVSQWPLSSEAIPSWPQFIEMLGLLVVAATGAGRFAGVDGLFASGCCPWRKKTTE